MFVCLVLVSLWCAYVGVLVLQCVGVKVFGVEFGLLRFGAPPKRGCGILFVFNSLLTDVCVPGVGVPLVCICVVFWC